MLIHKSWVVFVYAITISLESIIVEYLTASSLIGISPIVLSAISITLAGVMLLVVAYVLKGKGRISILFIKSWKNLVMASLLSSFGILTLYDSINRIGASKEVLLAGPLNIVIVVLLAQLFLNERLTKFHYIGIGMSLLGFIMAVASDNNTGVSHNTEITRTVVTMVARSAMPSMAISFGDIEAILSAFGLAGGALFLTRLTPKYSSIEIAGASMFTSGLILIGFMIITLSLYGTDHAYLQSNEISLFKQPIIFIITVLLLFSALPFISSSSYSNGLSKIGASLTSTIGSSSILMTIIIQLVLKEFGIASHLPGNILLAFFGGVARFLGIYLIHLPKYSVPVMNKNMLSADNYISATQKS
ncbi:MAG TPA: EamA family transporter [Nitrososphaeraceae archaeon]|nr:EamA family transporter [Nitrososphaeraceae archaeon]